MAKRNLIKSPPLSLMTKLGSIAVHAEEATSASGHPFDAEAIRSLMADPEVAEFLGAMRKLALLPVKRT